MTNPFENDEFWEAAAPAIFSEARWKSAPQEADGILSLLQPAPGAAVLDLCCGPGRIALELARRGYRVTGVDRTAAYLREAASRARRENLDIEFIHEDMREFARPEAFDAAINFYTSFGYSEDPADDRRALENVFASLKPGGRLLLEAMGREVLAAGFTPRDWHSPAGGLYLIEDRRIVDSWSAIETRWVLASEGGTREFTFRLRLYTGTEVRALLRDIGFSSVDIFGSLEGVPYDQNASRLVVLATK